jgi:diaminopimelate decarboxylase
MMIFKMKNRLALFPKTTQIKATPVGEELTIGGCYLSDLAERHGTPLYIYDSTSLDAAVTEYKQSLADYYSGETGITYAGKAFLCVALAQWTQRHQLWVDCSSPGELQIAGIAGVPRENIVIHGVSKSDKLLSAAITQAGTIVVDNLLELSKLAKLGSEANTHLPDLWLRYRPGLAVDTHTHIQTGQYNSKFGMSWEEIVEAADSCRETNYPLKGIHFHLGSQYNDAEPLELALESTLDLAHKIKMKPGWTICPGGGWSVAYHEDKLPHPAVETYVRFVASKIIERCQRRGLPLPKLQLEPGRSLVARACVALYRVGTVKQTESRRWVLIDGGLADNPRYALYQERYSALSVANPLRPAIDQAWLGGPYCESGDILIEDLPLPDIQPEDLIAIPVSGAYQMSMANNYNGALRPAVVWLENGKDIIIRERETFADLVSRDKPLL